MATLNPWSDLSQMGFFANHSFPTYVTSEYYGTVQTALKVEVVFQQILLMCKYLGGNLIFLKTQTTKFYIFIYTLG